MFADDVKYLCCPLTRESLEISRISLKDRDGEILEGELASKISGNKYRISNGIPRFLEDSQYNETWDYKWTAIDQGQGLNYRITDKNDPAYEIHDIFDRNNHGGQAYQYATGRLVLDLGCGIGQYTWRLLQEFAPAKVISMDLTRGVDIFRQIMLERFPELKTKILMVQGNVFAMPFKDETFDYVFSLGVLMHTGNTREAIRQAARVLKYHGQLNIWIYAPDVVHYDVREVGRDKVFTMFSFIPHQLQYAIVMGQINFFRRVPHWVAVSIIKLFSSDAWYRICNIRYLRYFAQKIFGTVMHPDRDYRFINNYDGWCNTWADTWSEHEIFPVLQEQNIVIKGISQWRTGIWGVKLKDFYKV